MDPDEHAASGPRLVHVDTDFAGDPDDACALAMLLGWPGVEITGITTNLDADGGRAACAAHMLGVAGRADIPVVAGAARSMTTQLEYPSTIDDPRQWPAGIPREPARPGAAQDLLARSLERGATVIAIGALTNLAALETSTPGSLTGADVVVMGGWLAPPTRGYPQWGPEMDFNIQSDVDAAEIVLGAATTTLVPLSVAMQAQLRRAELDRLRAAGPIGVLLARQSEAQRDDNQFAVLAAAHSALVRDLVNFHWDPVTAAVGVGWSGARVKQMRVRTHVGDDDGLLYFEKHPDGRPTRVVAGIDAHDFTERWLDCIEAITTSA